MSHRRINKSFYQRDVLSVAPELLGKFICRQHSVGFVARHMITEVEAYRGEDDLACHAAKGRTKRTEVMYSDGGHLYMYLIYGIHWMLNIVTGTAGDPQAVLIRGIQGCSGPGRLTRLLNLNGTYYAEDLTFSKRIWLEDDNLRPTYVTTPRKGVGFAGPTWALKPWRFHCAEQVV